MLTYRVRLAIAGAVMSVGVVTALLVLAAGDGRADSAIAIRGRICGTAPTPTISAASDIVAQNVLVLGSLLLGGLLFGVRLIVQLLSLGFNAAELYLSARGQMNSDAFALAGLLPHGLLEIPAFVSGGATAFAVLQMIIRFVTSRVLVPRERLIGLAPEIFGAVLALVVAGILEEFVTPHAMRWALRC